ncbi:MAG: hypothetical protein ACK417_06820 [Bacteroidia bacterium]
MYELPTYSPITFIICMGIGLLFAFFSSEQRLKTSILLAIWCIITASISYTPELPLKPFFLFFVPCLLLTLFSLIPAGRQFVRELKDEHLHYLHLWRLPFAFVLLWFYQAGLSSLDITFEGYNYDIVVGLTAPVIASLAFNQKMLNREILLGWNGLSLLMLLISSVLIGLEMQHSVKALNAYTSFPYAFALGLLLPMSLFAHALVIYRILKGYVKIAE